MKKNFLFIVLFIICYLGIFITFLSKRSDAKEYKSTHIIYLNNFEDIHIIANPSQKDIKEEDKVFIIETGKKISESKSLSAKEVIFVLDTYYKNDEKNTIPNIRLDYTTKTNDLSSLTEALDKLAKEYGFFILTYEMKSFITNDTLKKVFLKENQLETILTTLK